MEQRVRGRRGRTQKAVVEAVGTVVAELPVPQGDRDSRWRETFLARLREPTCGGVYDAAHVAQVDIDVVNETEVRDPEFKRALAHAIGLHTDRLVSAMLALGERGNNPVPHIVRLKALRPREYVEKHLVVTVGDPGAFGAHQARELLRDMLVDMDPDLRRQLTDRVDESTSDA